ncbi:tat (twin-arginine translocation) pathway signal sequence [Bordetella genomosp. 10]|uniref:Tat (Twin-arginine translocation) pathway signal sequence n=1 Tax=Bordetella genomosp. 10 TaxID=1416804 RepID=A0A261SB20_9BORD|nr:tat (twin-arginine translocation) pathway signal sequence [Bordetella genomosp. 10]OZI34589.1 tat (twin-arginine translocation) pathway signal sequence [Bordetella genomosp. 10]
MKSTTIPLAVAETRHGDGPARPAGIALTRREWLKGTGVLFGTLALSSTLAAFAPSRAWALALKRLDTHQGDVLLALTRRIYPHATLDDAVYALVVKSLDEKAAADPAVQTQLAEGVRKLDGLGQGDWLKRASADKDQDAAAIAGTPFFETVRSTAVVALYANPLAYAHFGYGANAGDGGYLLTGFNDLAWLPDPPPQDSGPVPAN